MSAVRVMIDASPVLLEDLLVTLCTGPGVELCRPGEPSAEVTIVTADRAEAAHTALVVVLGDRLDEPARLVVRGQPAGALDTRPDQLRTAVLRTVIDLLSPVAEPAVASSPGAGAA